MAEAVEPKEAPEPAAIPATKAKISDAYDLGDTDHNPEYDEVPAGEAEPAPASTQPSEPAGEPERPRGPDGRFLPADAAPLIKHPSSLIKMALDLGLSDDEIAGTSGDQLSQVVYHLNKQAMKLAGEYSQERALSTATDRVAGDRTVRTDPAVPPAPEQDEFDAWATQAGLYPELLSELQRLRSEVKELKTLKGEFNDIKTHHQAQQRETLTEQLDRAFSRHENVLGKGRRSEIKDGSPEHLKRMAVLGLVEKDSTKAPLQDKIDRVVKALYGEPQVPDVLQQRREMYNGAGLAQPTQRLGGTEPKGDKKAMATAHRMMKEQGLLDETTNDDFLD